MILSAHFSDFISKFDAIYFMCGFSQRFEKFLESDTKFLKQTISKLCCEIVYTPDSAV